MGRIVVVYTTCVNWGKLGAMAKSDLPAYEQVKAFIKQHIGSGQWRPGDPVPSETALMQQFGISRMTVNRALREIAHRRQARVAQFMKVALLTADRLAETDVDQSAWR